MDPAPIHCPHCDQTFGRRRNLKRHLNTACVALHPERPYPCQRGCGVRFFRADVRARHHRFCQGDSVAVVMAEADVLEVHASDDDMRQAPSPPHLSRQGTPDPPPFGRCGPAGRSPSPPPLRRRVSPESSGGRGAATTRSGPPGLPALNRTGHLVGGAGTGPSDPASHHPGGVPTGGSPGAVPRAGVLASAGQRKQALVTPSRHGRRAERRRNPRCPLRFGRDLAATGDGRRPPPGQHHQGGRHAHAGTPTYQGQQYGQHFVDPSVSAQPSLGGMLPPGAPPPPRYPDGVPREFWEQLFRHTEFQRRPPSTN
ncbi:basic salivary proline-rich protein 2-like [Patiria miniata]|uniref:C2H2-type domain-containing protein n=1 Tax=Patiria miniata TaxID=46514 RepID=A0A913ZWX4_PATMI|nr:basic salivary proline-rich protein 2-like [Patiria miniata]